MEITTGCNWAGSGYTCKDIPPGHHRLRLSAEAMAFVDRLLTKRNEVAGSLAVDFRSGTMHIVESKVSRGKRDSVGIPRGAILAWHSHPGKCPPRGADCALDVPSDADMALVMEDCMQGTSEHFVFAQTGTFAIAISPQLRHRLGALEGRARTAEEKRIEKVFDRIHSGFEKRLQQGQTDLDRFRPEWAALARQQGFVVHFFPRGTIPETVLVVGG